MPAKLEMFSEARIALMREVGQHPKLLQQLHDGGHSPNTDWPEMLGVIAAYCNIVMDGFYSQADLEHLYDIVYWKLRSFRSTVIIASNSTKGH